MQEFQRSLTNNEIIEEFDRHIFECIIDKVIVGEKKENGEIDPYKLKFVYKTGMKEEVALSQPFSFENSYSHTDNEYDTIYLHGEFPEY